MMIKTLLISAGAGVLAILAGAAVAQTASQASPRAERPHPAMRADADADGRISQAEFVQGRVAMLTAIDANRDGSVSAEERRSGMDTRRNQQASARFDRADVDGNGSLSREEFVTLHGQRGERAGRGGRGPGGEHRGPRAARAGGERGPMAIAAVQARSTAACARMDKDGDGYLTVEERRAARSEMRKARQEHRAERRAARSTGSPSPSTAASE